MLFKNKKGPEQQDARPAGHSKQKRRFLGRRRKAAEKEGRDEVAEQKSEDMSYFRLQKKGENQVQVIYRDFGENATDVLDVVQKDGIPEPYYKSDVVIKVQASTVSIADSLIRRGVSLSMFDGVSLPATPGFEVVGHIMTCGKNVEEWQEGDRVAALVRTGGNARYAVVPAASLVRVPRSLDSAEAACAVSAYMTAYQSLKLAVPGRNNKDDMDDGSLLNGKTVLVTGAFGPIGQALIQMCRRAGAAKIFATAPDRHHKYVRMVMGARPLPVAPEDWIPLVEGHIDIFFDKAAHGGFSSSRQALTRDGVLVAVGMSSVVNMDASTWFTSMKSYEVWSSFCNDPETFKADLEQVFHMLKKRQIKPHVAKHITLNDVADAHCYLEEGKWRGAVVCLPWRRGRNLNKHKDDDDDDDDDESEDEREE